MDQNITFIIDMVRNQNGFFRKNYLSSRTIELTESYFSLLKFDSSSDEDFSKLCLAATLNPSSRYLTVFPIDCYQKSVKTYVCYRGTLYSKLYATRMWEQSDFLFDPVFKVAEDYNIIKRTNDILTTFSHVNMTAAYKNIFSALWYTGLPCFDLKDLSSKEQGVRSILRYCEWKGQRIPCSAIFQTFPTDRGMCCSFNMKSAEEIFVGKTYSQQIKQMQSHDKYLSLENPVLPNSFLFNQEPTTEPGRNKGLTLIIDAHSDILSPGSVPIETNGFIGLIRPKGTFPITSLESFDIKSGHNNIVAISTTIVHKEDELRNLNTTDRKCLFEDETSMLRMHKNYSHSNCLFECFFYAAQLSIKSKYRTNIECIPWFFPSPDFSPKICDPWQALEVFDLMWNVPSSACGHCLPDCSSFIYKTSVTSVPLKKCDLTNLGSTHLCDINAKNLPSPRLFSDLVLKNFMARFNTTPSYGRYNFSSSFRKRGSDLPKGHVFGVSDAMYDAYDADIAKVQIYFKTASVVSIVQQPTMTWIDFYSNVGGILGFVLGIGIVTLFEVLFLLLKILKTFAIKSNFVNYFKIVKLFKSTKAPSL